MQRPIHYLKIKYRTCSTKTRRKRSPVLGPSYEIGLPLKDYSTSRIVFRPHTDGTEIIFAEIFSNEKKSPYIDKSFELKDRASRLWNDLYSMNKNNDERVAFYGEIALPNNLKDEELKTIAERIGQHLATAYNRQIQIGLHKKKGNYHLHFSGSEREYKNGKFQQKRHKFYKDINGNLIYDKVYKDANGWDIRKPVIDKSKVPKGKKALTRDPQTGNYIYQRLGERNKKQWECDTRTGKFLGKKDLSKLHNDIDNIINSFLQEQGYMVTVKRNRPEVTQMLNNLRIGQIRIPTHDFKTNSTIAKEIRKRNEHNKILQKKFEENFAKLRVAKTKIDVAKEIEATKLQSLLNAQEERILADKDFADANNEYKVVRNILKKSAKYLSKTFEI